MQSHFHVLINLFPLDSQPLSDIIDWANMHKVLLLHHQGYCTIVYVYILTRANIRILGSEIHICHFLKHKSSLLSVV